MIESLFVKINNFLGQTNKKSKKDDVKKWILKATAKQTKIDII